MTTRSTQLISLLNQHARLSAEIADVAAKTAALADEILAGEFGSEHVGGGRLCIVLSSTSLDVYPNPGFTSADQHEPWCASVGSLGSSVHSVTIAAMTPRDAVDGVLSTVLDATLARAFRLLLSETRFCIHCPGDGVHKMSCTAFKSGYVKPDEPCRVPLSTLSAKYHARVTIPVEEVK